jgi:hypothetical protein
VSAKISIAAATLPAPCDDDPGEAYAAIVLTVIGPLVTIAVALQGQAELGDRFDEVRDRARHEALARELKFGVTDVNGWQTAYGYDDGRSRPVFDRSVAAFRADLAEADRRLDDTPERELLRELSDEFDGFMELDVVAYRALQNGREEVTKRIFLGPELARFEAMATRPSGWRSTRRAKRARASAPSTRSATTCAGG